MMSAALDLTVIVEVLFQRSPGSSNCGGVGWFPFGAVSEAIPGLRKSEGRGKQSFRQNLDSTTAGQLLNPLRNRNDGLDPFAELFNGVREITLLFGQKSGFESRNRCGKRLGLSFSVSS